MYSIEDSDITLFGKILKNEQEEDSWLVTDNLKINVSELLAYYLSNKNHFKSHTDIIYLTIYSQPGVGPSDILNLNCGNSNNNILQNLSTFNYNSNINKLINYNSINDLLSYHSNDKKIIKRKNI